MALTTTRVRHHTPADPSVIVNGVRIDPVAACRVPPVIEKFLRCGRSHTVHFLALDLTRVARRDGAYRRVINQGDLNLPDGMPVAWAVRSTGIPTERVTGTDTMLQLSEWGVGRGIRHYYFGGASEVPELISARLRLRFTGLRVSGTESPPFRPLAGHELDEAAQRIRAANTDLLWIGLGAPKQDVVAAELAAREAAPVILAVGAAFDFLAGVKQRPPEWMQKSGLEWAGRLASEPRRLWRRYLIGNAQFMAGVVKERPALIGELSV